jgi:Secretion system C-terminal sorting domain/Bacterial Ig domain/PA14 domain
LPSGKWRNIYLIDQSVEEDGYQPALKQRPGSVIPLAAIAQSTETYSSDEITLLIAPDDSNEAYGTMYADAGNGFGYLENEFLTSAFNVVPANDDSLLVSCLTMGGILSAANRSYRTALVTNYGIFYSNWTTDSVFKIAGYPDLFATLDSPENGAKYDEGGNILLKASIEGDLPVAKVSFYVNSEFVGDGLPESWEYNWNTVAKGFYTIKAIAFSTEDIKVETATVSIQVGDFGTGEITYELWNDIGGSVLVSDLTSQPDYPEYPTTSSVLNSFETPANIGDEFGARVIGYVYPPFSGNYIFWISGDDYCELWLSTDSTYLNKKPIAQVPGWTVPGEWEKYPGQHSNQIYLESGKKYFIQALQKEAYNDDFLSVAWEFAGRPREIIPGELLSPWDFASDIEDFALPKSALSIYPNPAASTFTVFTGNEAGKLSIFNANGKLVFTSEITKDQHSLHLSTQGFRKGVYFVRFSTEMSLATRKLVLV